MGIVPLAAAGTPTPKQLVFRDLHRLGRRQFHHLAALSKGGVTQVVPAIRALLQSVLSGASGRVSLAGAVLVFGPLAARARLVLSFVLRLGRIGLDERGRLALVDV
jgi:hypothetical protein